VAFCFRVLDSKACYCENIENAFSYSNGPTYCCKENRKPSWLHKENRKTSWLHFG